MGKREYGNPKKSRTRRHDHLRTLKAYVDERIAWAAWQVTHKPDKDFPADVNKRALGLMPADSPEVGYFIAFLKNPERELRRNANGKREAEGYVLFFEKKADAESQAERLGRVMKKCGLLGKVEVRISEISKTDRGEYEIQKGWRYKLRITAVKKEDVGGLTRHEEKIYLRALRAEKEALELNPEQP